MPTAVAQPSTEIDPSQLRYYLLQAFAARTSLERIPLNHIGIAVQASEKGYLVTAALEGYPAHLAGINRGDIIHSVNNAPYHPVYSFNSIDANATGFVETTTPLDIEFERNGNLHTTSVTPVFENLYDSYRSAILNSVQKFSSGNKVVGYVRLWGLSRATNDLRSLANLIEDFDDCDGLIIDLRNSYGYLATAHLDMVFPNRSNYFDVAGTTNQHTNLALDGIEANRDYFQRPIALLINAETEAGAELFAYQLAKLGRVITLGEASAGKIGDYRLQQESQTSRLHYIPADDTLIDGEPFESTGVTPEQIIAYPAELSTRSDPQFEAALQALMGII